MDLATLRRLMRDNGATRCVFKRLAPNDNSKNQIYLGPDFKALNILPVAGPPRFAGQSPKGGKRFTVPLNLGWLLPTGAVAESQGAQLILYPQYPEVRLSGMIRGVREAPGEYFDISKHGRLPGRILILGLVPDGRILAWLEPPATALATEIDALGITPTEGVFCELPLAPGESLGDSRIELLSALSRIHQKGWIRSRRLVAPGVDAPCNAPNCGGYTLEAELGVTPNGRSEPDYLGWEVKQHAVPAFERVEAGVLTLMTPEPDGGFYTSHGVEAFIRMYGYEDRRGRDDRLNFGGTHYAGKRHATTGLALELKGFDGEKRRITDLSGAVALVDKAGEVAASWSFEGMLTHWNRKHFRAVYVPSLLRTDPQREYHFGHSVRLGSDTDFLRLLNAFHDGRVYYDPGIKLEHASSPTPKTKRRSQFRIKSSELAVLYERFETVRLPEC